MATLQELERAFVAADQAGNTADAQAFAAEIRRMRATQAAPQQEFTGEDEFEPFGLFTFPSSGPNQGRQEASRLSGATEGIKRLVAGGKQLAGAVSDFFTAEDRAGRGKKDQATAEELLRSTTEAIAAEERGLDMQTRDRTSTLTQVGSLAVAPEAALPRTTTVLGAMAKNFLSGGIGGAMTFEPDGSKLDDTVGGATSSALIGLAPSLPPAVLNMVGRGLEKAALKGRTAARMAAVEQTLPNTKFSLAQRTGVPELSYLEHRAYNLDQVNFFADQTDQFIADAAKALQQPIKPGQTLGGDAAVLKEAMSDHIGQIRKNASQTFNYGLSKAVTTALPDTTIPIDNFRKTALEIIDTAKADARVLDPPPLKPEYIAHLEQLIKKPAISVKEVSDSLRELTALQSSSSPRAVAYATKLRNDGLNADLDNLQQVASLPQTDAAIKTLLDTRAEYRRAMGAAEALANTTVYKLLDGAEDGASMLAKVKSFSPGKQESVRDFLQKHSPDTLRSLKQAFVDDAVARSGVIREAADAQQDLSKLQSALFDGDQFRASGLFSPAEMKRVDSIAEGLRVVQNNRPSFGGAGTPIAPEDVAINVISRSGPFMSRLVTRALTGAKASQLFTDPELYKIMTKFNRSTTGSATNLAGRAAIMAYLQENYGGPPQQ